MPDQDNHDFRLLAEHSPDIICRVGTDRIMRYVSPSITRILGWLPSDVIGSGPESMVVAEDIPLIAAAAERLLAPGVESSPATVRVYRKNGSIAWIEMTARLVRDPATHEPSEIILVMRDITERKQLEQQLALLAHTDSLTALPNRRAFDSTLSVEWARTLREGTHLSLLMIDIDNFKGFNDLYGHLAGDDCLRTIAFAIRAVLRVGDFAARYGGEELAVILPGTNQPEAIQIADRLRTAVLGLHIPHETNPPGGTFVSASIGVATALSRTGGTMRMPEALLAAADSALYRAKSEGRNRIISSLLLAMKDD